MHNQQSQMRTYTSRAGFLCRAPRVLAKPMLQERAKRAAAKVKATATAVRRQEQVITELDDKARAALRVAEREQKKKVRDACPLPDACCCTLIRGDWWGV